MGMILETVKQGKPVPVPVIDTHTHLGDCSISGLHQGITKAAEVVADMEKIGINAICTSPIIMEYGDQTASNEMTCQLLKEFPGKIYGNLLVAPHDGIEAAKKTVDTYSKVDGFVAMKFLTYYHGLPTRPEYEYAIAFAQEAQCPLTFHIYAPKMEGMQAVVKILEKYPRLKLILAHQGGGHKAETEFFLKVMKDYPNLYLDTCGSIANAMSIWDMAKKAGEDRLVYGSDILYMEPRYELGKIIFSGMPESLMKKILAENYLKLLEGSQLSKIKL